MKITLKEWLELQKLVETANAALWEIKRIVNAMQSDHMIKGNEAEAEFIDKKIYGPADAAIEALPHPSSLVPQSEWLGGDSDEPKNHALKEPNIVGYLKRRFTVEELAEVKADCNGPCQWTYR